MKLTGVGSKQPGHVSIFLDGVEQPEMTWIEAVQLGQTILIAANRSAGDVDADVSAWIKTNETAIHAAEHALYQHGSEWPQ